MSEYTSMETCPSCGTEFATAEHVKANKRISELERQVETLTVARMADVEVVARLREAAQAVSDDGTDYDGRFIAVDSYVFYKLRDVLEAGDE